MENLFNFDSYGRIVRILYISVFLEQNSTCVICCTHKLSVRVSVHRFLTRKLCSVHPVSHKLPTGSKNINTVYLCDSSITVGTEDKQYYLPSDKKTNFLSAPQLPLPKVLLLLYSGYCTVCIQSNYRSGLRIHVFIDPNLTFHFDGSVPTLKS